MPTPKTTDRTETTTENTTTPAEQGANAAPEQATSKKEATRKTAAPTAKKSAKAGAKKSSKPTAKVATKKAAKPAAPKPEKGQPREGSKTQIVLDLLRRKDGATMAEIAKATGWQNHSIRGFISGTLTKKMDLPVASLKNDSGDRVYRIEE